MLYGGIIVFKLNLKLITIMHLEKYSLTWNAYSDHLRDMMKELMLNDDFADVTLVSEDRKHIKAHKNILSACSPVFKDIVKLEQSAKQIIYLRGINFSELESIMQFIYLGEATFFEERMNEFIAVAKSLEIKELCNAENETNDDDVSEQPTNDPVASTNNSEEEPMSTSHLVNQTQKEDKDRRVRVNRKYKCEQCHKTFTSIPGLQYHRQSAHESVKYACDQCDGQFTKQSNLKMHIESKHEGVKYACDQCNHQATTQRNLKQHIESKHEGVKYPCDQCNYKATSQGNLNTHIRSTHEGVKYACDQCDYQARQQSNLKTHIDRRH